MVVFNSLYTNYPKCEECGRDLICGLDMAKGICGKCWFDSWGEEDDDQE
jgi:hypothetical protein